MIISLTRLPADGLSFNHQYQAEELGTAQFDFRLAQSPLVTGRLERVGADVRVRGEIIAQLVVACDRCLSDITLPTQIPFDLIYVEQADTQQGGETELHDQDLGLAFYEDNQINFDDLVLEQLELSLPSRVLCREDCRGLCAECGADLNLETCQCQKPIDPRWQALADLKAKHGQH